MTAARALSVLLLLLLGGSARAAGPVVVALESDGLTLYRQAEAGMAAELDGIELASFSLEGDAKRADDVLAQVLARKPAVVVAFGPLAANAARKGLGEVPVVFCLVPNHEKYGLDGKNVTGIALTRPVDDQLAALAGLLPAAKKVGVLYTPEYSQEVFSQAQKAAEAQGLTLVGRKLGKGKELAEEVEALAGAVDVIWMLADRGTANVEASKLLLQATRKAGIPLIALGEGQVREGALAAFTVPPVLVGAQVGKLARRIAVERINAGSLQVMAPVQLELWLNLGTAKRLGLDTLAPRALDLAARSTMAVRPVP